MNNKNKHCLSQCYDGNTKILHPLYLIPISNNEPFCLTSKEKVKPCILDSSITNKNEYFIPNINLNGNNILKIIYNIDSWKELYNYMKKDINMILITKVRLISYAWIAFVDDYRLNIETIVECYKLFINKDITDLILSLKKENINPIDYFEYIQNKI